MRNDSHGVFFLFFFFFGSQEAQQKVKNTREGKTGFAEPIDKADSLREHAVR